MLSLKFLESYLKKIHKVEKIQLQSTFSQLKKDYQSFFFVLEHIQACVFLLDQEGIPFFINEYAQKTFYLHNFTQDQSISNIIPIAEFASHYKRWVKNTELFVKEELMSGQALNHKIWSIEFYNLTLEQTYIKEQTQLAYMVTMRDITTEKKLQERHLLKKNMESMQHLAASLAHEIKNPLTSIHLYLNLVERYTQDLKGIDTKEIEHSLGVIKQEVNRLNEITTDFITNIRPLSLNITKIDPEHMIVSLRELIEPILLEQHIHLTLSLEENLPMIAGDTTYIRMVLLNILKNSIEAFEGKISKKNPHAINIKIEENSPFIQIKIQDNGKGISKEHLGQVFEPYFTTKKTGSGIGLSLVHKIILEHKGDIYIESTPSKGTTVTVLLPIYKGLIHKFLS